MCNNDNKESIGSFVNRYYDKYNNGNNKKISPESFERKVRRHIDTLYSTIGIDIKKILDKDFLQHSRYLIPPAVEKFLFDSMCNHPTYNNIEKKMETDFNYRMELVRFAEIYFDYNSSVSRDVRKSIYEKYFKEIAEETETMLSEIEEGISIYRQTKPDFCCYFSSLRKNISEKIHFVESLLISIKSTNIEENTETNYIISLLFKELNFSLDILHSLKTAINA